MKLKHTQKKKITPQHTQNIFLKWLPCAFFILIACIFVYVRIMPILNESVPYTYDQGRDFLKAQEIVATRNITFIGPTTGISGLYHGAWWYYFLSIPFALFNGHPLGFYFFMLSFACVMTSLFLYFLYKNTSRTIAIVTLMIMTLSPFFIRTAIFVSNDTLAPSAIIGLVISSFLFIKTRRPLMAFLTFLSLMFVLESEVAFGLFVIPAFLFSLFLSGTFRLFFNKKVLLASALGALIPPIPRLLFDVRNNFMQTKTLFGFFSSPGYHDPKPLWIIFNDRLTLFYSYFKALFYEHNNFLGILFLVFVVLSIILSYRQLTKEHKLAFNLFSFMTLFLFVESLLYKGIFWENYYLGIHILFLTLIGLLLYANFRHSMGKILNGILITIFAFVFVVNLKTELTPHPQKKLNGIQKERAVASYLYSQNKAIDFCVRIYTPPIIPYTYWYLFEYEARATLNKKPTTNYSPDRYCWYIIEYESEGYKFRSDKWREENIPVKAKLQKQKMIDDISIELWRE